VGDAIWRGSILNWGCLQQWDWGASDSRSRHHSRCTPLLKTALLNAPPPPPPALQQLEDQAAAAQQELEGLASRLAATTSRAEDAESARDAATGEGRWLRVKLANEAEGRREAEARLEATVSELKAQVTGRVETHWKKATAGVACQPQRRQWGIGKEQCKEGRH
jgi:hypothetical protein